MFLVSSHTFMVILFYRKDIFEMNGLIILFSVKPELRLHKRLNLQKSTKQGQNQNVLIQCLLHRAPRNLLVLFPVEPLCAVSSPRAH